MDAHVCLTPYDLYVLAELRRVSCMAGGYVRTAIVADLLARHPRTIRHSLARLERAALIARRGERKGWKPCR